jgi:hypothetical protein
MKQKNKQAVMLGRLRWRGKTEEERKAHMKMMAHSPRKKRRAKNSIKMG